MMTTNDAVSSIWVTLQVNGELVPIRYDQFVQKLFKIDTFKEMAHHAKGGLCEEAGEVSDVVKRNLTYGIPLTSPIKKDSPKTVKEALIEELGDVMFYKQAIQNLYGISDFEVAQYNANKLSKRYIDLTYTKEQAHMRNDEPSVGHPAEAKED